MIEELNLLCPYKVSLNPETSTYYFTTSNSVEYSLVFLDSLGYLQNTTTGHLISKVFSLNIDKLNGSKAVLDPDVKTTISCIVSYFFRDIENSLLYVCDYTDAKHEARKRKFNAWYNSSDNTDFKKLDDCINTEDGEHNTSLIYNINNPFSNHLEASYVEAVEALKK